MEVSHVSDLDSKRQGLCGSCQATPNEQNTLLVVGQHGIFINLVTDSVIRT